MCRLSPGKVELEKKTCPVTIVICSNRDSAVWHGHELTMERNGEIVRVRVGDFMQAELFFCLNQVSFCFSHKFPKIGWRGFFLVLTLSDM